MKCFNKAKILSLFILLLLNSCIDENPNLVNPPPQTETVKLRFLNLAGDNNPRILDLGTNVLTALTEYGAVSSAVKPPQDSLIASIIYNGNVEFRKDKKLRFVRNTNYTAIALPPSYGASVQRPVDTLIVISTTLGVKEVSEYAFLKVFNAYPDSNITYSVALGCPNGEKITQNLRYRSVSLKAEVMPNEQAISIIRHEGDNFTVLGLYNLNLEKSGQYCLIIKEQSQGTEEFLILNEYDSTVNAIQPIEKVPDRITEIRVINLSSVTVNSIKEPFDYVVENLSPNTVSSYSTIGACSNEYKDRFLTYYNDNVVSEDSVSLEVLKQYTILVFDSADSKAHRTIIAQPYTILSGLNNNAVIRVVNAESYQGNLTVSLGARNDTSLIGYSSGEKLTPSIAFGEISNPVLVSSGINGSTLPFIVPITIFTSTQPAKLITSTQITLEPNKSYILVINGNNTMKEKISLIEDNDILQPVTYLDKNSLVEVVNALPDKESINVTIQPLLSNGILHYTNSLATVLKEAMNTITIDSKSLDFTPEVAKNTLLIAAGEAANPDILLLSSEPMDAADDKYSRRFINACKEVSYLTVRLDSLNGREIAARIPYGSTSPKEYVKNEIKSSIVFIDSDSNKELVRIDDVSLIFNKKYSLIFAGSKKKGYSLIVQQQF